MRRIICICTLSLWGMLGYGQESHLLDLGGTPVKLVMHNSGKYGPLYYNMHDNENTSVEAAMKIVRRKGGVLFELVHSGGRYIEFDMDTIHYAIDPNRIYTDTGVWRELERTGLRDTVVFEMVRHFADTVLSLMYLDAQKLVVALHNNSDCRYCIYSYMAGGDYETDAAAVFQGKWKDPDEFYFVTEREHYDILQQTGFNIVLQNNAVVTDDGSLSVYCGQRGIQYINVEGEHGHLKEQKRMIRRMIRALK